PAQRRWRTQPRASPTLTPIAIAVSTSPFEASSPLFSSDRQASRQSVFRSCGSAIRREISPENSRLHHRDALYLDVELMRPGADRHEGARRLVFQKILAIDPVERVEPRRVRHVDRDLDDVLERRTRRRETELEVVEAATCLDADVTLHRLAGLRIVRRQPGNEDEISRAYHLRQRHPPPARRIQPVLHGRNGNDLL